MTEQEFKDKHGFNDEDFNKIKDICKTYSGKIISIIDIGDTK